MSNTFLISDTHFGHANSLNFMRDDGVTKMRHFISVEEMDETIINNWNNVVRPADRIYHLGDVVIARKNLCILDRLNGRKVLIKGNHDIFKLKDYLPYFDDIRGSHKLDKFILSHIPIHPNHMARWAAGNIHGHLHDNLVMLGDAPDTRYINVCVENIGYTPIAFEELKRDVAHRAEREVQK